MTTEQLKHITFIAAHYGIEPQTDMLIEEMSELTKALLKYRRAKAETAATGLLLTDIADELADVKIMLAQIEYLYNTFIDDEFIDIMEQQINIKIERQLDRIAAKGAL